jgi:TRAP-type C4-dicarboxylate transport system permease small subunit
MLARLAERLDRALAVLLAALLATIVLAVTWQVVSRYLLGDPSGWTEELARFLLVWIGLFGGALAYQRRLHLGIDLLPEYLRKRHAENSTNAMVGSVVRLVVDGGVLVFAAATLVVGGGALVALTIDLEQYSPALGLPMAVVYLSLPASGLVICISALAALTHPRASPPGTGAVPE